MLSPVWRAFRRVSPSRSAVCTARRIDTSRFGFPAAFQSGLHSSSSSSFISRRFFGSSKMVTSAKDVEAALGNIDPVQEALLNEVCILVDDTDKNIGAASKKDCHLLHDGQCLLHRAFSVFLFNTKGELLLQQRSDAKITFPNMFTNTCCSHPLAISDELDEKDAVGVRKAAQRKLEHELGIRPEAVPWEDLQYLTRIHYSAKSDGIWGEHEIDYILFIQKDVDITPNDNEIKSVRYVSQDELRSLVADHDAGKVELTPWFRFICGSHLFPWWNNLADLSRFTDHKSIHRY